MPTLEQVQKKRQERRYYTFFKKAFEVIEPETEYMDNWHVEYLCDQLQEAVTNIALKKDRVQNIVCNVPPGSMKSLIFSVMLAPWAWIHWPNLRFAVASYSDFLSLMLSVKSRDVILSDWYKENWGDLFELKEDENTKGFFKNTQGGFRTATTVGGSITGAHVDIFIGDDILNPKQADSESLRNTANNFWFKTVPSRFRNKQHKFMALVMQRLHEEDTAGVIVEKGLDYKHIVIPAELSPGLEPKDLLTEVQPMELREKYVNNLFFPTRFSLEALAEDKKTLGPLEYAGQYLQRPSPAEGNIIKKGWFRKFYSHEIPEGLTRHYYSDTAYGLKDSDKSATICFSVYKGNLYIWDVWKVNLGLPEYIASIKDFLRRSGYGGSSKVVYEPKATGWSCIQTLQQEKLSLTHERINILVDETVVKMNDGKLVKATSVNKVSKTKAESPKIAAGRVYLLADTSWFEDFIEECAAFPNGANDDQLDCLIGALRMMDQLDLEIEIGFA